MREDTNVNKDTGHRAAASLSESVYCFFDTILSEFPCVTDVYASKGCVNLTLLTSRRGALATDARGLWRSLLCSSIKEAKGYSH